MISNPLITIIVPVYNVSKYLKECFESIIHQSYNNIEIIIVDDGSTDDSGYICDLFEMQDKRIRVLHKTNRGLSDARNAGLNIAAGEYICFVDSDDYIHENMIESLYNACIKYNSKIAVCGRRQFYEDGQTKDMFVVNEETIYTDSQAIEQILLNGTLDSAAWDKIYKADLFTTIRYPYGVLHEDLNVTSRLFQLAGKVAHIKEIGYYYRVRKGSITKSQFNLRKMDLLYQTEALVEYVKKEYPQLNDQANRFYCFNITNLMTLIIKSDDNKLFCKLRNTIKKQASTALIKNFCNKYLSLKDKVRMIVKIILI